MTQQHVCSQGPRHGGGPGGPWTPHSGGEGGRGGPAVWGARGGQDDVVRGGPGRDRARGTHQSVPC